MSNAPEVQKSPEDVLSTLHADGKRRWMYPVLSKGVHLRQRFVVAWLLIAFFVALPLIDIKGKPAIFLDIAHREFTFFGLTLYSTDTLLLMLFILSALMFVLMFTAVAGRVWCGWGCPQTVYMEFVYRPVERLFEGKAGARRKRDALPISLESAARKTGKYLTYLVISAALAHTFVAYFVGWDDLVTWMSGSPSDHWAFFLLMAGTTGGMLFNFAYFREQMCTIACPYARIQSVLQDRDSMIVSYDPGRGESRGRRSKDQRIAEKAGEQIGLGDCVDCYACVRTCPTGIDIRDGLQMECIGCTQCIDACDFIMIKTNKPVGLIRYTSESALEGNAPKLIRPRTVLYTFLLAVVVSAFTYNVVYRADLELDIHRSVKKGEPLFSTLGEDKIMNRLRFRVQNRTTKEIDFHVTVAEPAGAEVKLIGQQDFRVEAGGTKRVEAFVIVPADAFLAGSVKGVFKLESQDDDLSLTQEFMLLGPSTRKK